MEKLIKKISSKLENFALKKKKQTSIKRKKKQTNKLLQTKRKYLQTTYPTKD